MLNDGPALTVRWTQSEPLSVQVLQPEEKIMHYTVWWKQWCSSIRILMLPKKMTQNHFLTLAWPCFPVLEVDISTILQGRPFRTTKPFLRRALHCCGYVSEAPASPLVKSRSGSAMVGSNQGALMGGRTGLYWGRSRLQDKNRVQVWCTRVRKGKASNNCTTSQKHDADVINTGAGV